MFDASSLLGLKVVVICRNRRGRILVQKLPEFVILLSFISCMKTLDQHLIGVITLSRHAHRIRLTDVYSVIAPDRARLRKYSFVG